MWKEKDGKIDQAEVDRVEEELDEVYDQEDYEVKFRHEEKNAEEMVMGRSRIVEGSVRKKENSRKAQRKNKEDRMKMAEIERQEDLKRLKNVKKKEIKEKMKKVLAVAGFKEGEECALDARDLDGEFDPVKYDKMMKAVYDEKYYGAEDDGMRSDEDDDGEKPDFDKEDELLGLPKKWDVIQSGDGFEAAREKVLKLKENVAGSDDEEEEEEEEEVEEEEGREGKRKRKQKTSLVKRAKEALMDEYYELDYEDTIDDLKTRFKFAKVQPNSYGLKTSDILVLDDAELNQFVPLKKMAPFVEKDWEVNKYKLKEQKLKIREAYLRIGEKNDKGSKKRKKSDAVEKTKPAPVVEEEVEEAESSKLSRKAKRRRREAEKKLPANRMVAYGKTN
uniref:Protein KRI1-like protein n=1 Tax=Noccaea caerulescens TaxID=107243 RepID=A0A1J3GA82_NOCCA